MPIATAAIEEAKEAASNIDADVYFFNGGIEPPRCLLCIEGVFANISRPKATLFLVTNGGSPDPAYKITRYFQEKYERFEVVVSGRCKSAGTLIALGAHELVFTPYGELGPLDIQLSKVDKFDAMQSGLTIQDSLNTLEARAVSKFYEIVKDYIQANNGQLSFASASKAASDFVTQLYAPVFARIDPEEVGARARSMKIAADYGRRLAVKSQNLKKDTLKLLSETYSSHSFVIDQQEAETLFVRVRKATEAEAAVVAALGRYARFEVADPSDFVFHALSTRAPQQAQQGAVNGPDSAHPRGDRPANGGNPKGPDATADPPAKRGRRMRLRNGSQPARSSQRPN